MLEKRYLGLFFTCILYLQIICIVPGHAYAETDNTPLAGFKVYTTVIRPDQKSPATVATSDGNSAVSTNSNNTATSKNVISTRKISGTPTNNSVSSNLNLRPKLLAQSKIVKSNTTIDKKPAFKTTILPSRKESVSVNKVNLTDNQPIKRQKAEIPEDNNLLNEDKSPEDNAKSTYSNASTDPISEETKIELSDKVKDQATVQEPNPITMVSSLFFVIIMVFIFAWIYSKLKGVDATSLLAGKLKDAQNSRFNLLSSTTLGQGKSIHLVEIKGKQLVIGSTNNNINLLTEIGDTNKSSNNSIQESNDQNFLNNEAIRVDFPEIYKEYLDNKDEKEE